MHADALDYIEKATTQFDLICVDLFIDEIVPAQFESEEILSNLSGLLNPGGILMFNRLYNKEELKKKTDWYYDEVFSKTLKPTGIIPSEGNKMLIYRAGQ